MSTQQLDINKKNFVPNNISFDNSGLIKGINDLANAVGSTLGAKGRTVFIETPTGMPYITKDGVTVANNVIPKDPVERLGAFTLVQAARRTASVAGDGTTTSTVLAQTIVNKALQEKEASHRDVIIGIENATKEVVKKLLKESKEVKDKDIDYVASIATNNNPELGEIISGVFREVGRDGGVNWVEDFNSNEITTEVVKGSKIPSGYVSEDFSTKGKLAELINPFILLTNEEIPNAKTIEGILEKCIKSKRPLLIVGPCSDNLEKALLKNKQSGVLQSCIVTEPYPGKYGTDVMNDIAFLTGATLFDKSYGDDITMLSPDYLGEAKKTISYGLDTVFTVNDIDVSERVEEIKGLEKEEKNKSTKEMYKQRLSILNGGIGTIKVGAPTEVERKELLDRVEDAVNAVGVAIEGGILPGGGNALRHISKELLEPYMDKSISDSETFGYVILLQSIVEPYNKILTNAGLNPSDYKDLKKGEGIDVLTGKKVRMYSAGIIDPTNVTINALTNAVSVAKTILSTKTVITHDTY